jgi:hypothetical protein
MFTATVIKREVFTMKFLTKKFKLNSKGFTLMEAIVAMSMVAVTASFTATAIASTQKSTAKTHEISLGTDNSFTACESFLAGSDTGTEGEYKLVRSDDGYGISELDEIKLSIYDTYSDESLSTNDGVTSKNVRYVAFKHAPSDAFAPTGNNVNVNGGGLTNGDATESSTQEATEPPYVPEETTLFAPPPTTTTTETTTETTTQAPTTVATTTTTTTTEATTETTTQAPVAPPNGNMNSFYANNNLVNNIPKHSWEDKYSPNSGARVDLGDGLTGYLAYSVVSGIDSNGILLNQWENLQIVNLSQEGVDYPTITVYVSSPDGSTPTFKITYDEKHEYNQWYTGVMTVTKTVTGNSFTFTGNRFVVEPVDNKPIYVTGTSAAK